ncbi:MAG TPA: gluconate 2-dehydrogenase subunit 3 family protein [Candidatus Dormibacteraeota bacterium]|nr:gluconate 2-dehydrogenase subunit 3 family protein [Candidatus Dormibacteraeota bacterium]
MEASIKLNRRAFLQAAVAAAAAAGTGVACTRNRTPWRFFTIDEARALAAISDQIIPPDQDPGASWAGVVNYIDRQLCGPFQSLQKMYRQGLAGVDQSSSLTHGKAFADLDSTQQIELLHLLENGRAPGSTWQQVSSREFFEYVVDHTMQGYYGDPRHGGNREGVSWKMLNLPYPPIRGRIRYDQPNTRSR